MNTLQYYALIWCYEKSTNAFPLIVHYTVNLSLTISQEQFLTCKSAIIYLYYLSTRFPFPYISWRLNNVIFSALHVNMSVLVWGVSPPQLQRLFFLNSWNSPEFFHNKRFAFSSSSKWSGLIVKGHYVGHLCSWATSQADWTHSSLAPFHPGAECAICTGIWVLQTSSWQ